jgi:small multidrug resistance family-3 protein
MNIIRSLVVFILAGLCEIGGGYLVWLWLKDDKPWWYFYIDGTHMGLAGRWF